MIGSERADELTRVRMRAPFERCVQLYKGLVRLTSEVAYGRADLAGRGTTNVPLKDVEAHFRALAVRLQEQGSSSVLAMNEWRELVPDLVGDLEVGAEELPR